MNGGTANIKEGANDRSDKADYSSSSKMSGSTEGRGERRRLGKSSTPCVGKKDFSGEYWQWATRDKAIKVTVVRSCGPRGTVNIDIYA